MKYSNEFKEMVCEEYLHTDIGRKGICEKYNLPLNTIKCWLFRYYPNENKDDKIDIKNRTPVKNNNDIYISKKHLNYKNINEALENYMHYFNYERPAAALNYLTPVQYKEFCESQKLKLEELTILN